MDDERSDKDETDESEEEEEDEEDKKNTKKNGPVQNGHTVHNNNHSKTEWKQTSYEKDSYPSVGEQEGGLERKKKGWGLGGGVLFHKTKNGRYLEEIWHCYVHMKTHSHTFIRTFWGHRDQADDVHHMKWHGFFCFVIREKKNHLC